MGINRLKLTQVLLELAIPLLGFFYWKWSLFFISLFLFIDLLANAVLLYFKVRKIDREQTGQVKNYVAYFLVIALELIALFWAIVFAVQFIEKPFLLLEQLTNFVMLKDMGMPQGFFLIPLIVISSYMQYNMEFVKTKTYVTTNSLKLIKRMIFSVLFAVVCVSISGFMLKYFAIPEVYLLIVGLVLLAAYGYFVKR